MGFLPAYGMIGFLDLGFGLVKQWEIFAFAFIYGGNLGNIQSYTRSMFADLIPTGHEAEFFALYEITDKGSSWMGPLVVSILYNAFGSLRLAFVYLTIVMLLPIVGLWKFVDYDKGIFDARGIGDGKKPVDAKAEEVAAAP